MIRAGRDQIAPAFDLLASRLLDCTSYRYEIIGSGAGGDLACSAGIEHTTALIGGAEPVPCALRVRTVFRREDGEWKIKHRHGDALPGGDSGAARRRLGRLEQAGGSPDGAG